MAAKALTQWLKEAIARQMALFDEPVDARPLLPTPVLKTPVFPNHVQPIAPVPPMRPHRPELPPLSLADAIEPTVFVHPLANRQIKLSGTPVSYVLKRGKRRTIGFSVGPDGLAVSAPRHTSVGEIEAALMERAAWILSKLGLARERGYKRQAQRINWADGATLPFLGESIAIHLDASHAWGKSGDGQAQLSIAGDGELRKLSIGLPANASADQIRDTVQAWLMRQARRIFAERLVHFEPSLGVRHTKLKLSSADTRWGSASGDGSIRLNWRLVHFPMRTIDYVVVHELSHLRVMDHSPRFWGVVGSVMPDYAHRRAELKSDVAPTWK